MAIAVGAGVTFSLKWESQRIAEGRHADGPCVLANDLTTAPNRLALPLSYAPPPGAQKSRRAFGALPAIALNPPRLVVANAVAHGKFIRFGRSAAPFE